MIHRFCEYLNLRVSVLVQSLSKFFIEFGLFETCSFLPITASGAGGIRQLGQPHLCSNHPIIKCTVWPGSVLYRITMSVHETKQSLPKRSRVLPNFGAERIGFMLIRIKLAPSRREKGPIHR